MDTKTVLDFSAKEAKSFFLQEKNYFTGDLPPYFSFQEILNRADEILKDEDLSHMCVRSPSSINNVNYDVVVNKDGKYAWRKLTIINPILYVDLVNCICYEENWTYLKGVFKQFKKNENIQCSSIPIVPGVGKKQKGSQINNWVTNFEKEAAKLSVDFSYVACTDISDCYSSIYTHVIPWALYGQEFAKRHRGPKENFGNILDCKLRNLSYGQTNGIPQGSVLMDFIAEIVLGYIDVLLAARIENSNITDYKILRYRDDYKIFTNNLQDSETIIKHINDICRDLGLKLNSEKTFLASNVIMGAIKKEKFYVWPEGQKDKYKLFLALYKYSKDFENTGSLQTYLSKLNETFQVSNRDKDLELLLSIMVDIAYNSPKVIPQAFAIISKILKKMPSETGKEYIKRIKLKFDRKPYTDFVYIWLQRLSLVYKEEVEYTPLICKLLHEDEAMLWDMSWLLPDVCARLLPCKLVNKRKLKRISLPIDKEEINIFDYA